MQLELLFLGKTREVYLAAGIEDFYQRLRRYVRVTVRTIKEKRGKDSQRDEKIKERETKLLLAAVPDSAFLVAMDPAGKQVTSGELAGLVSKWEAQGHKTVTFMIGGPLGLAPEAIDRADTVLSLSKMTFTHEMTRLILLEQLYRAYAIKAGSGYHK